MISEKEALEYEIGRMSFIDTLFTLASFKYFRWVCKRRYKRYESFMTKSEINEIYKYN